MRQASVFAESRESAPFVEQLVQVEAYLDRTARIIDDGPAAIQMHLPALRQDAADMRFVVRRLANLGLEQFVKTADVQRDAVSRTMIQLAVALAGLIGALAFLVYYLNRLYHRSTQTAKEQKQTANRMNTIIDTSLDGVIVSDDEGRIIEFSPAAETIFGYKADDVLGKDIGEVIVPDHLRAGHRAGMERMRTGGKRHVMGKGRVTLQAKRASGAVFPVELALQSAVTDDKEIFIAFLRDISKRVADQEELVAARDKALAGEKMKTDFLATMSHEIRTPLNGLLGNMHLLRDTALTASQDRYMQNMETSGRLLMSHVSNVLDITRYDAGKLSTLSEPFDVSKLMQDIIDSQSSMVDVNETTLAWGWDGEAHNWINSDHDRLQLILINLVSNAVKFTKRGKVSLTARVQPQDDHHTITFEVSDTGSGMSKDLATRIFDDFVTGNTTYIRDVGGTGLGLSIAKRFVTALDGHIRVDSVEGKGSSFYVELPVTLTVEPQTVQRQTNAAESGGRRHVLLVEDNEINRLVAREMLERDGHVVTETHDGQQGVQAAKLRKFDLILMDISMPVLDGRMATRAIRAGKGPSAATPIIALTANAMAQEQKNFITDGMNGVLTKPLTHTALRQVLRDLEMPPPVSSGHAVDTAHVAEMRETLGDEAYQKLLTRFRKEVDDLVVWLSRADHADGTAISARCHQVGGSAAMFGAIALRDHLAKIEKAAKSGDDAAVFALIDQMPETWDAAKAALA